MLRTRLTDVEAAERDRREAERDRLRGELRRVTAELRSAIGHERELWAACGRDCHNPEWSAASRRVIELRFDRENVQRLLRSA